MSTIETGQLPDFKPQTSRMKKTVALSLATFIVNLTKIALAALLARVLTLSDLAAYNQTLLAYQTFVPVLGLGITQALYYLLANNENRQTSMVRECLMILAMMGFLYSAFILAGGRFFLAQRVSNPQVANLLLWMVPLAIFVTPSEIRIPIWVYNDRLVLNAYFSAFSNLFNVLSVFFVAWIAKTAAAAVATHALSNITVSVVGLYLAYRMLTPDKDRMRLGSVKTILAFSLPLGLATMLGALSHDLDKWIISFMRSPEEYAVFSYGAYELPFINTLSGILSTVIIVDMVEYAKRENYSMTLRLFRRIATLTSYFIFPIMLYFMVVADPFYRLMYTDRMANAVPVFRVYLLALPIRTVLYGPLLIALGQNKQVLYKTIIGLVANLIMSVVLVYFIGTIGATVATVLSLYLVYVPINLRLISRRTKISWTQILPFAHYGKCLLMALLPAGITLLVMPLMRDLHHLYPIVIAAGIFALTTLPMYFLFFREDFLSFSNRLLRMVKGKFKSRSKQA